VVGRFGYRMTSSSEYHIFTHTYTCIHKSLLLNTHPHMHTHTHPHTHTPTPTHTHTHTHTHTNTHKHTHTHEPCSCAATKSGGAHPGIHALILSPYSRMGDTILQILYSFCREPTIAGVLVLVTVVSIIATCHICQ